MLLEKKSHGVVEIRCGKPSCLAPDLVSVESLDTTCETREVERKGITKSMEFASDKENWFGFKTKALFETQHYQECFEGLPSCHRRAFFLIHYFL